MEFFNFENLLKILLFSIVVAVTFFLLGKIIEIFAVIAYIALVIAVFSFLGIIFMKIFMNK